MALGHDTTLIKVAVPRTHHAPEVRLKTCLGLETPPLLSRASETRESGLDTLSGRGYKRGSLFLPAGLRVQQMHIAR